MKKYFLFIAAILIGISVKAQKIQASVNYGAHLIETTDWSRFNNNIISVENLDGTNKHFYYKIGRPINPNAMYVEGIDTHFPQNTPVYVCVIKPNIKVLSAPSVQTVVSSGPYLEGEYNWSQYASTRILVEELDGTNQHIYTATGTRAYNPEAMLVSGLDADFIQGAKVQVYNLDEAILAEGGKLSFASGDNVEKVSVKGKLRAMEIKVETSNWPDYVFTKGYQLPSLKEVENFIKEKKHLPEIPSAAEVECDGLNLGEMNNKLLKKIEELTFYIIDLNKQVEELKQGHKRKNRK